MGDIILFYCKFMFSGLVALLLVMIGFVLYQACQLVILTLEEAEELKFHRRLEKELQIAKEELELNQHSAMDDDGNIVDENGSVLMAKAEVSKRYQKTRSGSMALLEENGGGCLENGGHISSDNMSHF